MIGLGEIGRGLAAAISRAGIPLSVYDIRGEATLPFRDSAQVCDNLDQIGRSSDVLVVAVLNDEQVLDVLDEHTGVARSLAAGSTVVIVSTVSLDTIRRLDDRLRTRGLGLVDCGVSGGASAAADGELVSMVGGDDARIDHVEPVIEAFSSKVVRMGPLGAGQRAKLARNLIQFGAWLAAFEGQRVAEASGIELGKLADVVKASDRRIGGVSALMFRPTTAPFAEGDDERLVEAMKSAAALARKDLSAAIKLGDELGMELPVAKLAADNADAIFGVGTPDSGQTAGTAPHSVGPAEGQGSQEGHHPPAADRSRGRQRMEDVYGFSADPDSSQGDFMAYTVDHLFGDVWSRPGLDLETRRMLTIGVLAAQGQHDLLRVQFDAALANGEMTETQIRELVIHLAHYAGWPLAAGANNAAEAAIAHRSKDAT